MKSKPSIAPNGDVLEKLRRDIVERTRALQDAEDLLRLDTAPERLKAEMVGRRSSSRS